MFKHTAILYVDGQKIGSTDTQGRLMLAGQFVLDLIEVDRNNIEHWNVLKERKSDNE